MIENTVWNVDLWLHSHSWLSSLLGCFCANKLTSHVLCCTSFVRPERFCSRRHRLQGFTTSFLVQHKQTSYMEQTLTGHGLCSLIALRQRKRFCSFIYLKAVPARFLHHVIISVRLWNVLNIDLMYSRYISMNTATVSDISQIQAFNFIVRKNWLFCSE